MRLPDRLPSSGPGSALTPRPRYQLLDAWVLPAAPTSPLAVGLKVLLDQGLQTPLGMALFFASLKLMEGRPGQVVPELRAKVGAWARWGSCSGC